jgi:hypothetical protein
MNTANVTRVEIINHYSGQGRMYTFGPTVDAKVEAQLQDDGRTLKVFISEKEKKETSL